MWYFIKKIYCKSPSVLKTFFNYLFFSARLVLFILKGKRIKNYKKERGMDLFYDAVDWLGGFPYQSATKNNIINIVGKNFELIKFFDCQMETKKITTA